MHFTKGRLKNWLFDRCAEILLLVERGSDEPPGLVAIKPARECTRPTASWKINFPSTAMFNPSTPAGLFAKLVSWMETSAIFFNF
jgi:hypothetical protein